MRLPGGPFQSAAAVPFFTRIVKNAQRLSGGVEDPGALRELRQRVRYVPPLPAPTPASAARVMSPTTLKDQLSGRPSVGTPGSPVPPTGYRPGRLQVDRPASVAGGDSSSPRRMR